MYRQTAQLSSRSQDWQDYRQNYFCDLPVTCAGTPAAPPAFSISMKPLNLTRLLAAILVSAALAGAVPPHAARAAEPSPWVTAYYPVWEQAGGMSPDKIDFSAITHLVHFSITPRADGTIEDSVHGSVNTITPAQSADVVPRAHKAGDKVLVCLGGAESGPAIRAAIAGPVRGVFIQNLIAFIKERGYDGIDVDMEPILPADEPPLVLFVRELRAAMKAVNPKWLLTFPASGDQAKIAAQLQDDFDQINIQTYDLSGPWEGWKTWYNGPLYGEGKTLLTAARPYPSVDEKVGEYLAAGVPKAKLGIGIAFYGCVWNGANGPTQPIQGVTMDKLAYSAILDRYDKPGAYHWDAVAHAPYFRVGTDTDPARKFVSFDDARLAREKVLYARTHGLGGVIIWELGGGYRDSQPAGQKDALLQAVSAARGPLATGQ